jgi:tetratricopeptide (TPR) repeat protein
MGLAGISRHTLVRRDGTARIEVWVDLYTQAMSGETCLRRHLSWLQRRFARASLKVRSAPVHIRSTSGGLRVHHTEREALGPGPRRHAGRYLLAFAADGRLCHGFQAFAAVPASRAARREVRRAFQTFDVDPAVRGKARTEEVRLRVRRLALGAEKSGNPILLLDASTALAGLWPEDALGWQLLGTALLAVDRPADALHSFDLARRGRIEGGPEEGRLRRFGLWTLTADAYARMRKWPEADGALDEARKILPDHPGLAYAQGCLHALRGRVERAIDSLEASFRSWPTRPAPPRIPHGLGVQVALARRDARLASLRREPRFEVLLRRFEARARKGQ